MKNKRNIYSVEQALNILNKNADGNIKECNASSSAG